jgi:hypothetical protein
MNAFDWMMFCTLTVCFTVIVVSFCAFARLFHEAEVKRQTANRQIKLRKQRGLK